MPSEINEVTLNPTEIARLHVEDGIGTDADMQLLVEAGIDVTGDQLLRGAVQAALRPETVPLIADGVMRSVNGKPLPVGQALVQELEETPGLSAGVMARLGALDLAGQDVADAIHEEAGDPGSIWNEVAGRIGVEAGLDLSELIQAAVAHEAGPSNLEWMPKSRSDWKVGPAAGVIFAMAAAVLLWVQTSVPNANVVAQQALDELPLFEGPVEIESLDVGAANIAQVLQFDENSPTIIFVGEFEEQ